MIRGNDPIHGSPEIRWHIGWGLRIFAALCLGVFLTIGGLLAFDGARTSDRVGGVVFLVVAPILSWVVYVRPFVELSSSWLVIRNPLRSHLVRVGDVVAADSLNTGLRLRLQDGTTVVAWALQQGLLVNLLGLRTRVVKAEEAILAAARVARDAQVE